jgi:hypothetical protein
LLNNNIIYLFNHILKYYEYNYNKTYELMMILYHTENNR